MRSHYLGPWRIDLDVRPDVARPIPIYHSTLVRAIARALEAGGAPEPASIELILSGDAELAELNATHLGHEGATDVLSFPLLPAAAFPPHEGAAPGAGASGHGVAAAAALFAGPPGRRTHLGDVVVSVERAVEQAGAGRGGQTGDVRWSARDELRLLVTHGTLHLCGWDHADPAEEAAMRALEQRLLAED